MLLGSMAVLLGTGLVALAELRWTAPAECPSQAVVAERLRAFVGDEALRPDVVAHANVERSGDRWVLELSLRTPEGSSTRRMVSDECRTLADAAALVVATHADPVAASARAGTGPPAVAEPTVAAHRQEPRPPRAGPARPRPGPVPSAEALPVARRVSDQSPGRPAGARWGLRAGATAGRATQADLDLGPDVALSWQRGLVRVAAEARALVPRRQPVPEREGAGLRQWLLAGGLEAGVVAPLGSRVGMLLGLGVELGPLVARGEGITRPHTVSSPWLAALGTAQVVWRPRPRWGLWAGVVGVAGVLVPRFTVAGAAPLVAGPGGLRAVAGLELGWGAITNSTRAGHSRR